jgi:flagellar motor switch protein FliG
MTATSLDGRLRQIAILVASVDTTAARQVLMNLPTDIAKRVRALAADMGPIPPEERRALLEEFQRSHLLSKAAEAKSAESSAPDASRSAAAQQAATSSAFTDFSPSETASTATDSAETSQPTWTRLGVETLVRLVSVERPTVIAVVMQQLPATQAAAVLQRLPRATTKEVLSVLGGMHEIDEEAMKAIDEHLSERLRDYHHKIESEMERTRRVNELLAVCPVELKTQWSHWLRPDVFSEEAETRNQPATSQNSTTQAVNSLDQLYRSATITTSDPHWNQSLAINSAAAANASQHRAPNKTAGAEPSVQPTAHNPIAPPTHNSNSHPHKPFNLVGERRDEDGPITIPFPSNSRDHQAVLDRQRLQTEMDRLLRIETELLARFLSSVDGQTILLALAGASPAFMKKFRGILIAEDAQVLDSRLQQIGQVSLRQIDEAQQRLVTAFRSYTQSIQAFETTSRKRAA